jgi:hypothetical protein
MQRNHKGKNVKIETATDEEKNSRQEGKRKGSRGALFQEKVKRPNPTGSTLYLMPNTPIFFK